MYIRYITKKQIKKLKNKKIMKNLIELLENQPLWLTIWFAVASLITGFLLLKSMKRTYTRLSFSFGKLFSLVGFIIVGIAFGMVYDNFLGMISASMVPIILFILVISATVGFSDVFGDFSGSLMLLFITFNITFNITFIAVKQDWWYLIIVIACTSVGVLIGYLHERRKQKTILIS